MKKSIALVALAFGVTGAFAQDLTSKKGEPFLPEAGDYMIGVDANPFLNYVGNFFGGRVGTNNQAPTWNYLNAANSIVSGKYFKDATTAYRVGIRLGYDSKTTKNYLSDVTETGVTYPSLPTQKEDKLAHKSSTIGLTVGIEKRKGKTRLQGFYGADLMVWGSSVKDKYTYGQAVDGTTAGLTSVVSAGAGANTSDFSGINGVTNAGADANIGVALQTSGRITSKKVGGGFGFGVRAFIGAEYFVAPKISIGGEFGWGIGYMTGGKTVTSVESIGGTTPTKTDVTKTEKNGGHFVIDTDLNKSTTGSIMAPSANLRLNLHF